MRRAEPSRFVSPRSGQPQRHLDRGRATVAPARGRSHCPAMSSMPACAPAAATRRTIRCGRLCSSGSQSIDTAPGANALLSGRSAHALSIRCVPRTHARSISIASSSVPRCCFIRSVAHVVARAPPPWRPPTPPSPRPRRAPPGSPPARSPWGRGRRRGAAAGREPRQHAQAETPERTDADHGDGAAPGPCAQDSVLVDAAGAMLSGPMPARDLSVLRADFPALQRRRNGKPPIYMNNTCMTLRPRPVIEAITRYYEEFPTCGGGRAEGAKHLHNWFMEELKLNEEGARDEVRRLLNAKRCEEIVWTRNTSEALNIVAHGLAPRARRRGPRQRARAQQQPRAVARGRAAAAGAGAATRRSKARRCFDLAPDGSFSLENGARGDHARARRSWRSATRATSTARRSPTRDLRAIAKKVHANGGVLVVDAAQSVPAPPRRRAGARRRLPRLLHPQDVRPQRRRRALRAPRAARAPRPVRRRRRHDRRHVAGPRRSTRTSPAASRPASRTTPACSARPRPSATCATTSASTRSRRTSTGSTPT